MATSDFNIDGTNSRETALLLSGSEAITANTTATPVNQQAVTVRQYGKCALFLKAKGTDASSSGTLTVKVEGSCQSRSPGADDWHTLMDSDGNEAAFSIVLNANNEVRNCYPVDCAGLAIVRIKSVTNSDSTYDADFHAALGKTDSGRGN